MANSTLSTEIIRSFTGNERLTTSSLAVDSFIGEARTNLANWMQLVVIGALASPEKKPIAPLMKEYLQNFMIGLRSRAATECPNFDADTFEAEIRIVFGLLKN